jgi:nitrile hydratase subunit beta
MNGIHDMGGMQDMGPIQYERNEPVFHAPWEGRVWAMARAVQATRKLRVGLRPPIESLPAIEYLRSSYYELWLTSLIERMVGSDLVTRSEIESGRPEGGAAKSKPPLSAAGAPAYALTLPSSRRNVQTSARFQTGQQVRARNINPTGHTRLPRYARGKFGTIDRILGAYVFPDTSVYSLGDDPQYVYSVRFSARELWGPGAMPQDVVYIDMWDDYLEPV